MKCFVSSCGTDFHGYIYENEVPPEKFSAHRIPDDPIRRIKWLQAIAAADNKILVMNEINFKTARVCSKHFRSQDYAAKKNKRILLPTAVPTLFGCFKGSESVLEDSGFNDQVESSGPLATIDPEQISPPVPKRRRMLRYAGDVVNREITPEEAVILLPKVQAKLAKSQKTVKLQRCQIKRLSDRLENMQQIISKLNAKNFLSDTGNSVLQNYAQSNTLFLELTTRTKKQPCSEELRRFATTLHFYSPKAYSYVRSVFNKTLPYPRTIIRWYGSVNGEPGITKEALEALKVKSADMEAQGKQLLGCLMMDEMAIRQQVLWNEQTKKLEGVVHHHANRGSSTSSVEKTAVAKEALVYMVTGVHGEDSWKIPVAYFLINGMSSEEKKELTKTILTSLHDAGVKIIAFTFDGTATNLATANALGCSIKGSCVPLITSFKHPASDHEVFVIMDPVHMLKLIRNTWHTQKVLITPNGNAEWKYIEKLNQFQNEIGQKLAPNLTEQHVCFENSKMKVVLAAQLLSNSVATALDQLTSINADFADCAATIEFVSLFNDLFDVTNSMNENAQHFKKPLSADNFDLYYEAFDYIEQFIRGIRLQNRTNILHARCKTGFLGFLVALESFKGIFKKYVNESGDLDQVFTYRFSQDHLENFFGAIRSKNGSNDNPNCIQFKASYKRLMVNNDITNPTSSNCRNFNNIHPLSTQNKPQRSQDILPFEENQQHDQLNREQAITYRNTEENLMDYNLFVLDAGHHIAITKHITEVQRKLVAGLTCQNCSSIANSNVDSSIVILCKITEYEFKLLVGDNRDVNIGKYFDFLVSTSLLRAQNEIENLFENFADHGNSYDHKLNMIKQTIMIYLNIKFKLYSKTMKAFKPSNRQKLTKLILFEGN